MIILVIDGQGGGVGKRIVEALLPHLDPKQRLIALGTNSHATTAMLKAGAPEGASGENAIIFNAKRADLIIGPLGIITANSLLGELTAAMATAIATSSAEKILLPTTRCRIHVVGAQSLPLSELIELAVEEVKALLA